jgi:TRAP-type C4-dicarboxylate transport system permease small subunit
VSEPSDGDKPDHEDIPAARVVRDELDVPETRKHDEPPLRTSQLDMGGRLAYPDDGPLSARLRRFDTRIGQLEQIALVALLATVVATAAGHALLERFIHVRLPFKDDVIRGGTFAIAMLGAAFASHQARHLSMDLISRRLSPRARLFLKVILAAFTVGIVLLLIRAGLHNVTNEKGFAPEDKLITRVRIAYLIPIGGALIIGHTVLHAIIDIDYILRRKTPPERMRSGH